jgi:hypothetical protein
LIISRADLSAREGYVYLCEYIEEHPLFLSQVGMTSRIWFILSFILCIFFFFSYFYCKRDVDDTYFPKFELVDIEIINYSDTSPLLGRIQPGFFFFIEN